MSFQILKDLNLQLGDELMLEFWNGTKIKATMAGKYTPLSFSNCSQLLLVWNKADNTKAPRGFSGFEWRAFPPTITTSQSIHPDKEKFGEFFRWELENAKDILGEKIQQTKSSVLTLDDMLGFPGDNKIPPQTIKLPDFPCRQCKRPNNETDAKCWWCEVLNPVAKPLRCQRCNFADDTVRKIIMPFLGEKTLCKICHP